MSEKDKDKNSIVDSNVESIHKITNVDPVKLEKQDFKIV